MMCDKSHTPGQLVVLEGNLAVGKTSIINYLSKDERFAVFPEPVDEWRNFHGENLLQCFYRARKNARTRELVNLQILIASSLHRRDRVASDYSKKNPGKIVILERCQLSAAYFINANQSELEDIESHLLLEMIDSMAGCDYVKRAIKILIYAEESLLLKRLKERGREAEDEVDLEYLRRIDKEIAKVASEEGWFTIDTSYKTLCEVACDIKSVLNVE